MFNKKVKVLILRTAGTNCDQETMFAFSYFGADVRSVHIKRLINKEVKLSDFHILAIPGGFTYGDDIESGRILANELRFHLGEDLCQFMGDKKLIIGICNGFQILTKAGILPGPLNEAEYKNHHLSQSATLTNNDSGKFEDRWCHLKPEGNSVWIEGVSSVIYLPVAHGEGKFMTADNNVLQQLERNGQVVFRYCSEEGLPTSYPGNPNGAQRSIAGIVDRTGRILGLMPHPERHFFRRQHPFWTRLDAKEELGHGAGIFKNGIEYVKENLL